MDAASFDRWTRLFAVVSRRAVLRGLAGGALTAATGQRQEADARQICRKRGEDCTTAGCCGFPRFNLRCAQGVCKCKKGFADCDGNGGCETNVLTDPTKCGRCTVSCADGACLHGTCSCSGGFGRCPAGCTTCAARKEGGAPACIGGISSRACATDAECPPRTVCLINGRCSVPCGSA